ncbi:MAG TPA: BACON domain-containing carbohydrate-binding protein [Candidatus Limnocylindrales bacterium]|nr:BACON domain-containing carbohydrate-binding protein [Candidatus Limnocylindrales bacterium]
MRFLALLLLAPAGLLAQQCQYTISANTFVAGAAASSTNPTPNFIVTTKNQTCTFMVSTNATWIHILNGPSFTGDSTVMFVLDSNATSSALRKDTITVTTAGGSLSVSITQVAGICNFTMSGTSDHFGIAGGTGSFDVITGCGWGVTSLQGFINFGGLTSFLGPSTVKYTVAPNSCVAARTATVTVETGQFNAPVFQVTQDGSPANLSVSPAVTTVGSGVNIGRLSVNTGSGCSWSAFSDVNWLTITGSASGGGAGGITYTVAANVGAQRTGSIHIGPALFTVTQLAAAAPAPQVTTILNAASYNSSNTPAYANGPISPGEIVAIGGSNMGPTTGAPYLLSTDGKSISNLLVGTQVTFNGIPAPLLYASATQINAIVPLALAGSTKADIQVVYLGTAGNTLTEPVQAATPGLFSIDKSGAGPGAILNQDFSVNGNTNRASRGSVIAIYCTGTGINSPAGQDGVLTDLTQPFPSVVAQLSVTIGGVPANVVYAGAAPGSVAGLTQINVVVPDAAPSGNVPVLVQVGGVSSQAGLTVAVQ